jgi:hypothetical protein
MAIVTKKKRTPEQFARFVASMVERNPKGFRSASSKGGHLTLLERASLDAGFISNDSVGPEPSARGRRKRKLRQYVRLCVRKERQVGRPLTKRESAELWNSVFPPDEAAAA